MIHDETLLRHLPCVRSENNPQPQTTVLLGKIHEIVLQ